MQNWCCEQQISRINSDIINRTWGNRLYIWVRLLGQVRITTLLVFCNYGSNYRVTPETFLMHENSPLKWKLSWYWWYTMNTSSLSYTVHCDEKSTWTIMHYPMYKSSSDIHSKLISQRFKPVTTSTCLHDYELLVRCTAAFVATVFWLLYLIELCLILIYASRCVHILTGQFLGFERGSR